MSDLISRLSELRCQYNCFDENERDAYHTLSEAIKTLSDVPDTNVGDTISRQAAIDAMMKLQTEDIEAYGASIPEGFDGDRAVTALKALPSAQPTVEVVPVRYGYWIRHENADIVDGYLVPNFECSECHSWKEDDSDYCPDCGTRMDGKDGDGNG